MTTPLNLAGGRLQVVERQLNLFRQLVLQQNHVLMEVHAVLGSTHQALDDCLVTQQHPSSSSMQPRLRNTIEANQQQITALQRRVASLMDKQKRSLKNQHHQSGSGGDDVSGHHHHRDVSSVDGDDDVERDGPAGPDFNKSSDSDVVYGANDASRKNPLASTQRPDQQPRGEASKSKDETLQREHDVEASRIVKQHHKDWTKAVSEGAADAAERVRIAVVSLVSVWGEHLAAQLREMMDLPHEAFEEFKSNPTDDTLHRFFDSFEHLKEKAPTLLEGSGDGGRKGPKGNPFEGAENGEKVSALFLKTVQDAVLSLAPDAPGPIFVGVRESAPRQEEEPPRSNRREEVGSSTEAQHAQGGNSHHEWQHQHYHHQQPKQQGQHTSQQPVPQQQQQQPHRSPLVDLSPRELLKQTRVGGGGPFGNGTAQHPSLIPAAGKCSGQQQQQHQQRSFSTPAMTRRGSGAQQRGDSSQLGSCVSHQGVERDDRWNRPPTPQSQYANVSPQSQQQHQTPPSSRRVQPPSMMMQQHHFNASSSPQNSSSASATAPTPSRVDQLRAQLQQLEIQLGSVAMRGGRESGSEAKYYVLDKKLQRVRAELLKEQRVEDELAKVQREVQAIKRTREEDRRQFRR